MSFNISKEVAQQLESLKSSYKIKHRKVGGAEVCRVEIVDLITNTVYASADDSNGKTEEEVLSLAVAEAMQSEKPETAPEMIQRLQSENAAKDAEIARLKDPDAEPAEASPLDKMTSAQIAGELTALGYAPPQGDRRSNKWREPAIEMLKVAREEAEEEAEDQDARPEEPAPAA